MSRRPWAATASTYIRGIHCGPRPRNSLVNLLPVLDNAGSCGHSSPAANLPADRRLPRWLKRNLPVGNGNHFTARLIEELKLETVCESAKCPNRMECWSHKTATFMIL